MAYVYLMRESNLPEAVIKLICEFVGTRERWVKQNKKNLNGEFKEIGPYITYPVLVMREYAKEYFFGHVVKYKHTIIQLNKTISERKRNQQIDTHPIYRSYRKADKSAKFVVEYKILEIDGLRRQEYYDNPELARKKYEWYD